MSSASPPDPRFDRAAASDESMLVAHERALGPQPDEKAHYPLRPLVLLFILSGCILFAATYLNRYSGHFNPAIYNENLVASAGAAEAKADPVALGKRLFNSGGACFTCHQPTGVGVPSVYPPLAGSEWANGPEARVIRIVLFGLQGPVTVKGQTFMAAAMPSFGPTGFNWSDEKVADVLTYVRQEWGNKSAAISADQVAAIRQSVGEHKAWFADELMQLK